MIPRCMYQRHMPLFPHDNNATIGCDSFFEWDVLCGRHNKHKHSTAHPGNQRFRSVVQSYCEEYQSTKMRCEKTRITKEVISIIQGDGGRFLKPGGIAAQWIPLNSAQVYEKVSHALRSAKVQPRRRSVVTNENGEIISLDGGYDDAASAEEEEEIEEAVNKLSRVQQHFYQQLIEANNSPSEEAKVKEQQQHQHQQRCLNQSQEVEVGLMWIEERQPTDSVEGRFANNFNNASSAVYIIRRGRASGRCRVR